MEPKKRVYGVRRRGAKADTTKFCCDFETEACLSDQFDVFPVDIEPVELALAIDSFLATLAEESQIGGWKLFRFRIPSQETDTEVIFSEKQRLAVFDKFELDRRGTKGVELDELKALLDRRIVEKGLTVESAIAKLLNRKLVTGRGH